MPGRNQPRSRRGRSAIARTAMNTNSTNGLGINNGGGMKKGGAHPSATGFMRSKPWQISVPARKQMFFNMNKMNNNTNIGIVVDEEHNVEEIVPAPPNWTGLITDLTNLKTKFNKQTWNTPFQTRCPTPGPQDYKWGITGYLSTLLVNLNTNPSLAQANQDSSGAWPTYFIDNSLSSVAPTPFQFQVAPGSSDIIITPAISVYNNFYTNTLYNYCSAIQDYTALLDDQKNCFTDTYKEITELIAEMENPSSIKSCIKTTTPSSCILNNSNQKKALNWANSLQTYINNLKVKFDSLLAAAAASTPITLSAAQVLVSKFNDYSKAQMPATTEDLTLNVVQLSKPTSMTTPISGCLWGNLPTTIGHIQDKFNEAVTACTLSPACVSLTDPSNHCIVPATTWRTYDEIFDAVCRLTNSNGVPIDTIAVLCTLTTNLRYMTDGKVWSGSIIGIKNKLNTFFEGCCDGTNGGAAARDAYRALVKGFYIPTSEISIPDVTSDIKKVNDAVEKTNLDDAYTSYASYFNKMRVWLTFYYGPQVGGFLVNALETNYLKWYNNWHASNDVPATSDFKTVTDLMWTPEQLTGATPSPPQPNPSPSKDCSPCTFGERQGCYIKDATNISTNYCCIENDLSGCKNASTNNVCFDSSGSNLGHQTCLSGSRFVKCTTTPSSDGHEGVLDAKVTALQDFMSSDDYTDFLDGLLKVRTLQSIISQGKYTLAIGMEYASNDKNAVDDILDVLKLLPDNLKVLSTDLKAINTLNDSISTEFLLLLSGARRVADFSNTLVTAISETYTDAFKKSIVDISGFIDTSYNPMVNTITVDYSNITLCVSGTTTPACGSSWPGAQASIWQDTGSMWSHFPSPDELNPTDATSTASVASIFGPWFKARAQTGVFNYHLSFAQLDVVADILSDPEVSRKVDTTTLNDTILPYVIAYQTANKSPNLKAAYKGFLGELKTTLKTNTNGKGNLGLSFGGENADASDNRYLSVVNTDATTMADAFYETILMNVDSVDFDNENAGFNPVEKQATFFQTIRKLIDKQISSPKPKMMLTLLGNPATSTGLGMQPLMANSAQYFDGINLMLYDNGTGYYITANEGTAWSLQSWANAIDISTSTPENILNAYNKLSPCYQDQTPYNDPNADKGESGPNWAVKAASEIQKNYGVDITTLSVGEAAWVLNRQFLYDALSSYDVKVTDASMQEFITNKADTVSWWPDNNLHGSLCPDTNDKGCNQYGVQQAFSACQILFKLGYNPFTFNKWVENVFTVSTTQDAYGAKKYSIDGVQQKDLTLQVGKTYDFSYTLEHPLRFSAIPDGTHTHLSTYIEEIPQTHITQISATQISFTVTEDMLKKIYYYCGNHPGMGAMITIEN